MAEAALGILRPSRGATLFEDLTEASAPSAAQPLLAKTREIFGFAPALAVAMAAEPAALEGYLQALGAFLQTGLTPIEQQIVLMTASRANDADYSVAVHASFAEKLGAAPKIIAAAGNGRPIADTKLRALQRFVEALTLRRGRVPEAEIDEILAAGYDRAAIVAAAFGVAVKIFANAMAHLARPEIDAGFAPALARLGR